MRYLMNKIKCWILYFLYLVIHKYYVARACFSIGLIWRGVIHDISKFRPSEFFPYADYFSSRYNKPTYGNKPPFVTHPNYNVAWLKHKHRNKHHWQYWISINNDGSIYALPMSEKIVKEMVCDWYGASKVQNNLTGVRMWFENEKDNLILHKSTVILIYKTIRKLEINHILKG